LEHVLSVSSTIEDFEKLDTEALIKESQTNRNYNDENELMGDHEENNSLNNGGAISPSLLSQAASVVVMSPISWASATTLQQQQDLDEDLSMLDNEEMNETSKLASDVDLPLNESKLLEEGKALEGDEALHGQPGTDQNSEDGQSLAGLPSAKSTKSLSTCQSSDNIEEKRISTENQLEEKNMITSQQNHEEKQKSAHHLISENPASKETQIPSESQISEKTKLQDGSQSQEQKSIDSQKSEKEEDQSLNKENSSEGLASSTTSTLNDSASDTTELNFSVDDKKTDTDISEAAKHALDEDKSDASLVSKSSFEESELVSSVKEKRKELSDTEPDAINSDSAETKLLGEKRRKLSVEPDES
jgi:hypothetical protein